MNSLAPPLQITALLNQWRDGDNHAGSQLMVSLYPVLRKLAQRALRPSGHQISLCATELAHEAYLRLLDQHNHWANRQQFLAISARVTRNVLIDLIRERNAEKRGGDREKVSLQIGVDVDVPGRAETIDWIVLEQSLQQLETRDPVAGRIVELRYFGGLNNEEIGELLGIGVATVVRRWKFARAWLHRRL